jgi:NAD(P)-dependent dehydrogenase (short-subunit alcohol dehydrogenase family)
MSKIIVFLLTLMVFQLLLLLVAALQGFYKYFLLTELNLRERYGAGSWVVITGASSGQGYDLAMAFAERGFNLLLIGSKRTEETVTQIQKAYPGIQTKVLYKDFRQAFHDDFFVDIQAAFEELGADLAILVNNVGHRVGWNPYHAMNANYIRDVIATGAIVQSRLTHMAIPYFLKRASAAAPSAAAPSAAGPSAAGPSAAGPSAAAPSAAAPSKKSALINITAQCMHPNFLFGLTLPNEISVPYLSVYEAANAFGFYQGNSIYKEYQDQFDILNITPGAVITKNTTCLSDTLFNVSSPVFVKQIMKMVGNVQGHSCAYWGHALSNYLINFMPLLKDRMLKKVGETIAADFMAKTDGAKYDIKHPLVPAPLVPAPLVPLDVNPAST